MILKLEEKHIVEVAKIRKENLPSFLTKFPLSFIEKFYHLQISRKNQLLLGVFENEQLAGFVFGTDDVEKLYEDFIQENKFYFYFNTFKTLLFNPKYLLLFLGKFLAKTYVSPCKRQLVYIAVDSKTAKKGFGISLLKAFEKEWEQFGYYELEVESKNSAFNFYKKNGFFLVHEANNWVEKKYLLGKNLK